MYQVPKIDLLHMYTAFCTFEAELDQLENSGDWFTSDSRDRLASSKQILEVLLGIKDEYNTEDITNGLIERTPELRFD